MGLSSDGTMSGYWYCGKSKELFDLSGGEEHLEFLLINPESLKVHSEELEDFLAEYDTDVKHELRDLTEFGEREVELLIFALNHGNVRIRLYDTPGSDNFISVEYNSKRNMKYVTDFLITFEDELKATHLPIYIYNYETEEGLDFKSIDAAENHFLMNENKGRNMEKIFAQILRESLKRKDGVYILSGGGLNADYHNIEVWKDGEIVEKTNRQYAVTPEHEESIFNQAKELADKYNLKIYDGTGAFWSGFSEDWYRHDKKDTSGYVKRGAEWVEYSDQDMKDLDDRPEVTTKWAICTAPGKFDIYDNVQKNPNKFFDTELYRGMAGSHGDRLGDLKKFFNEHADKVYQGTFDDIKDGNYTIAVNGRFYQSDNAKKMIDRILAAGLEFNGKRVTGQVNFGEQRTEWGDYRDEIVEVSCGSWEDENEMTRLTQIYDVLTMTGIDVPDEFAFSSEDEPEYMVVVDSNKNLHHTSSSSYKGSKDLKVGDIIELTRTFPYEYSSYRGDSYYSPLFVVIETDGINAKLAPCSDIRTTHEAHSIHDRSEYEVKFNKSKYDSALKGTYKEDETKKLNMLQTRFTKRTKDFVGEQFSESIRTVFAQILKESGKIGE